MNDTIPKLIICYLTTVHNDEKIIIHVIWVNIAADSATFITHCFSLYRASTMYRASWILVAVLFCVNTVYVSTQSKYIQCFIVVQL